MRVSNDVRSLRLTRRRVLGIGLLASTLLAAFGPGLTEHVRFAADPWHFNDDTRQQTWEFLRYRDPALFRDDYIADYYEAAFPRGYWLLYRATARVLDPRALAKLLPYAELVVVTSALMATSGTLGGAAAAWGTGALCLSSDLYLDKMSGGLPRSFAFPLFALMALALVRGQPRWLCAIAVIAAAFYYPAAYVVTFVTGVYLLLLPASWRGAARDWSLSRRAAWLGGAVVSVALLILPAVIAIRSFGPLLGYDDVAAYPEAGPAGRLDVTNQPAAGTLSDKIRQYAERSLFSAGPPWHFPLRQGAQQPAARRNILIVLGIVLALGTAQLLASTAGAARLLLLPLAGLTLYGVALVLWPFAYIPTRYLSYTIPVTVHVLLPTAAVALVAGRRPTRRRTVGAAAFAVALVACAVLVAGAKGPGHQGITVSVPETERPLHAFLAELPPDVLIAGWPADTIDNVPYVASRRILAGFETHMAFHKAVVEEMRRRVEALIDAYFSSEAEPLRRLRREFGVTHLVMDRAHFGGRGPHYFAPFDALAERSAAALVGTPWALRWPDAIVFETGTFAVVALDKLPLAAAP